MLGVMTLLKMCMTQCLDEGNSVNPPFGEECFVCLHDYEKDDACIRLSACGHVIHKDCLNRVFHHGHKDCPMCRKPLKTVLRIFSPHNRLQCTS